MEDYNIEYFKISNFKRQAYRMETIQKWGLEIKRSHPTLVHAHIVFAHCFAERYHE
jgi:hypothetical protein